MPPARQTPPRTGADGDGAAPESFNSGQLRDELDRFRQELRAAGLRESAVHSYLMGSRLFIRRLAGDYVPGRRRADRPSAS